MRNFLLSLAVTSIAGTFALAPRASAADYLVYIGTYTRGTSKGIYAFRMDGKNGKLSPLGLAAEIRDASFVAPHPNGRYLYAVSEVSKSAGKPGGSVSAFAIDRPSGKLRFLNQASSAGSGPCYVVVDKSGRDALVANYGSGSVAALPIDPDGKLREPSAIIQHKGKGPDPKRQEGPHAHSINPSPDDRFAVAADLGLDELLVYRFDAAKASLTPNNPPYVKVDPGAGPRHFAFHPSGKFAYVINEMASTVTAFAWDGKAGVLKTLQTITTIPKDFKAENSTAEVQVHPNGKFLYGSNRGHDSIAVFAIDGAKGTLTPVERVSTQGKTPRNFGIDPSGSFLIAANQDSNTLVAFRIDAATGRLTPTGQKLDIGAPVCVKFVALQ